LRGTADGWGQPQREANGDLGSILEPLERPHHRYSWRQAAQKHSATVVLIVKALAKMMGDLCQAAVFAQGGDHKVTSSAAWPAS